MSDEEKMQPVPMDKPSKEEPQEETGLPPGAKTIAFTLVGNKIRTLVDGFDTVYEAIGFVEMELLLPPGRMKVLVRDSWKATHPGG